MEYQIGSLADLISGSKTPHKRKVFEKKVSPQPKARTAKKRRADNLISKPQGDSEDAPLQKKARADEKRATHTKKRRNKKRNKLLESNTDGESGKQNQVGLYNDRTIFVGNVAIKTSKDKLKKLFEQFGKIETVRFRCVPLADPRTPKKVATIKKEFHPDRQALHSYIRFSTRDEALKALALNGHIYKDLHLRVNICDNSEKPTATKAVFVGNIPFDAEEEDLWKLFETCGPIESVRLIRDNRTNIGKGFGYVNFKSPDAVHLALEMEDLKLKNRVLRVSQCKAEKKVKKELQIKAKSGTNKKHESNPSCELEQENKSGVIKSPQNSEFQGKTLVEKKKKKKFDKGAHRKKKMIKQIAPR